ncbi:KAT8 regulatory NSL complex subunit 1-like protein isoform X2 [Hoplias malabaricus]
MDSDGAGLGMDIDPTLKLLEDSYTNRFWLNLSSVPYLDSCSSKGPLEITEMFLPSLFHETESLESVLLSNPGSLFEFLSMDINGVDTAMSPKASPDVQFSVYEDQTTAVENCPTPTLERLDHSTEDYLGSTQSQPPWKCPQGQSRSTDNVSLLSAMRPQETSHIKQNGVDALRQIGCSSFQMEPSAMKETLKALTNRLASQHKSLLARADRAKQRLHALLGKHALKHCSQQLQGLDKKLPQKSSPLQSSMPSSCSPESKAPDALVQQNGLSSPLACSSWQRSSQPVQLTKDVKSLAQCGQAILQEVQRAVDSDATASSSDEEWDHEETQSTRASSACLGCEWRWQCERAKLASCWTWLKLRLSELDSRIQQLSELHKHILTCKKGVVLAESQPLTDRQIQQMLLTETAGLALTAGNVTTELDAEPSSPTRLLWNIERQSAQLSQIVNSLMAPLSVSPSSSPVTKGVCSLWKGHKKRPLNSFNDSLLHSGSTCLVKAEKRRRVCRPRQCVPQVDTTFVCARTRPLLTYHKPRLFTMSRSSLRQQGSDPSASLCFSCASCDPVSVCSDPFCSSTANRARPMCPLSSESSLTFRLKMGLSRENWLWKTRPLHTFSTEENTPHSLFNCTHQLPAAPHVQANRRECTPLRWAPSSQEPPRQGHRRTLKRRHHPADAQTYPSEAGVLSPTPEDSTEEAVTPYSTRIHQRNSQFPVRRRNGESVYNINNIVIPMSLAASTKVEKPQYKDIVTPSWKTVDITSLVKKEEDEESVDELSPVEVLSDEVFSQRHRSCEYREKLRWGSWEKGRRCSRRTRSMFSNSGCMKLSEFSADVLEPEQMICDQSWDSGTSGSPPELSLDETQSQLPWEQRVFPLSEEEEEALRCDEDIREAADALWSEREAEKLEPSFSEGSSENSLSSFCCNATAPSAGHMGVQH